MIDYSLYLVTSRDVLPLGKDFFETLEQALKGGVTVVQIREKTADTAEFLEIAQRSKAICDRYNVPLFINDRVDIALAIGAVGVHVGQSDMPIAIARKLLPPGSIIGTSCNNVDEVKKALADGADYIGIGAVWATATKELTKPVVGVRNVGAMLGLLDRTSVKAVAIGGINAVNLLRTLHGSVSRSEHPLDGVAVVSAIMGSKQPDEAAAKLRETLDHFKHCITVPRNQAISKEVDAQAKILHTAVNLIERIRKVKPLVHQITNNVAIAQSANLTISIGASPIMATTADEMSDLAKVSDSLLVNIGTLTQNAYEGMMKAGTHMNLHHKPIVFDPVGVGATAFRKQCVNELLNTWQTSVIKGNAGELAALAHSTEVQSKGVDSVGEGFKDPESFVKKLAQTERCVVVLTGKTDYVSDGISIAVLQNGHQLLGEITASGCITGSCIASFCAVASRSCEELSNEGRIFSGDLFAAAITGISVINIAAELAAMREEVRGPGTFFPALLDELARLTPQTIRERANIILH